VRSVLEGLVQQHLLGLALVPYAAGGSTGRAGHHRQGGAGAGVRQPQLPQLRVRSGVVGGAGAAERLPVARTIRHPGQRPVDRTGVQPSYGYRPVVVGAVFSIDAGQQPVP
jgi:hypothetical protein